MNPFVRILLKEMNLALGCTEPIAIAYTGAVAASFFGLNNIKKIDVYCSPSIIKNAHCVNVPNAKGRTGIKTAVVLGMIGGNPDYKLEVLRDVNDKHLEAVDQLLDKNIVNIYTKDTEENLFVNVIIKYIDNTVSVLLECMHDHISQIKINDEIIVDNPLNEKDFEDYSCLSLKNIYQFVKELDLNNYPELKDRINLSIQVNSEIANEGLNRNWGLKVGKTIQNSCNNPDVFTNAKALTAAGSDARMSGCSLPVMINSGSGNQGITASIPIITYAKENNIPLEQLQKALILSNLIAIHQKHHIGKLSAFCGVVCSSAAASCGIAYLMGLSLPQLEMIVSNTLVSAGGILCDGATPSCALKIATSLDCAFVSLQLAKENLTFNQNEGLVGLDTECTIDNIGTASKKMKDVDNTILEFITKH